MKRSNSEEDQPDELHCLQSMLDYCNSLESESDQLHLDCLKHVIIIIIIIITNLGLITQQHLLPL